MKPVDYKASIRLGIYLERYERINTLLRKEAGARWSRTLKCWHLPLDKVSYGRVMTALKERTVVNDTAAKAWLQNKKQGDTKEKCPDSSSQKRVNRISIQPLLKAVVGVNPVNHHVLPAMKQQLILKAYSASTIKTYLGEMSQFLNAIKSYAAEAFTVSRIRDYLQYCFEKLSLSENTMHSRINALKFYYEQVLHREKFLWEIPRPKKPLQLPAFFSQPEIQHILNRLENLKHKVMLMVTYSAGLRVSEVVSLKTWQIDSTRMQLTVQAAKGKKDRVAPLSPVLLVILRAYYTKYQPRKDGYLFEGIESGRPYSKRSLQKVMETAKKAAGITGRTHKIFLCGLIKCQ